MYSDKFLMNYNNCNNSHAARARRFVALCAVPLAYSLLGAVATVPSIPVYAQSFSGLGFLTGGNASQAAGVNTDGTVVVGISNSASGVTGQAFRWTRAGGMVGLGYLQGNSQSVSAAVNADGSVVAGYSSGGGMPQAIRWTGPSGLIGLGYLSGKNGSTTAGVSAGGSVVVGTSYSNCCNSQAFRWTVAGGIVGLGAVSGYPVSFATGVNTDGSVAVGVSYTAIPGLAQPFRWTAGGGMVGLGHLPGGNNSFANAVNADGSVVVGGSTSADNVQNYEAVRWTKNSGMVGLGYLSGDNFSDSNAVNADGSVIVGCSGSGGACNQEFLWTAVDGMKSVQALLAAKGVSTTGWTLTSAQGVSADGQVIVGVGVDPSGRQQGWIATLGPPRVPFLAFSAALDITFAAAPNDDSFNLHSPFTLSSTAPGLHPHSDPVTLQIGTFVITIPPGSFTQQPDGSFFFAGVINGVSLKARIAPTATLQYTFHAKGTGASLTGAMKPVYVTLIIGGDSGVTSVKDLILY
jgi:probable HAF family extracellular repeat protein